MWKKILTALMLVALIVPATTTDARSLWVDNPFGMYAERKARNVGDIVTIIISENTTTSASRNSANSKEGSVDLGVGTGIFHFLQAASASGSDSFSAQGTANSSNSANGRVTVTVVDVLPNDNMVVEGTQSIWQNRNEHKITLRGIIRRDDVSYSNTVYSYQVADATLKFDGKGPLNAKQRQGILTQIFNILF